MIINGDCLLEMRKMDDNSIDFIICDPPYALNFMNKDWDNEIPTVEVWKEALRICKPGSWLAAFGGTRTYHRLTCCIEDAGWTIRDCIMWIYGSGFPKSHNKFGLDGYGTALKPAYEPIILAMKTIDGTFAKNVEKWGVAGINIDGCRISSLTGQQPNDIILKKGEYLWEQEKCLCASCANIAVLNLKQETQEIREFFATSHVVQILKEKGNLHLEEENIAVIGCFTGQYQGELRQGQTVDINSNISKFGKIILDQSQKVSLSITLTMMDLITASKICNLCEQAITSDIINVNIRITTKESQNTPEEKEKVAQSARWPAHLILDEESAEMLDQMTGKLLGAGNKIVSQKKQNSMFVNDQSQINMKYDNGGFPSRFFYCAKASTRERNEGLEGMPLKEKKTLNEYISNTEGRTASKSGSSMQNNHPTVKPLSLMRYIIKLLAPPGNPLLLDPFAGSGSTCIAALQLGIKSIGIEKNAEYCEIARKRLEYHGQADKKNKEREQRCHQETFQFGEDG